MANWEENEYVKRYLNNLDNSIENTFEDIANAYYIRDIEGFNLNLRDVFFRAVSKLGLNPEKSLLNKYKAGILEDYKDISYTDFLKLQLESLDYKQQMKRYNILTKFLHNNNHREFYLNLSKNELEYLGW